MKIQRRPPRKILVPIDFSRTSFKAWELGRELAGDLRASLESVFVYEVRAVPDPIARHFPVVPLTGKLKDKLAAQARRELGPDANTTILQGFPTDAILSYARQRGVDLIVMGTHGHSGVARVLLGSVTEALLRRSPIPVLTVRGAWVPIRSILVPLNFMPYSLDALAAAAELSEALGARFDVLHVSPEPVSAKTTQAAFDAAVRTLPLRPSAKPPRLLLRRGDAAEEIVKAGADYDLIAMTAHRKSMFKDVVIGTTVERVLRHSSTPVLALPDESRPASASKRLTRFLAQPRIL